ncbi:MAG: phosphoribosylaminoimidazolesuccinocarboxamide synthase [Hyphomicrobiales bacterium]|nr:phosphoribosylaminoimidazolesuccinocarboxamide synthase [Hyphomicrobiales bacterium]MBV8826780.1 phosphoribosylaminoimidazolesuccinocarboxamide synthase [Hyphomicrobiales bacterium]
MKQTLRATHLAELGERLEGKVRDIYLRPRDVVLVATDRHSSFDRIIAYVPGKGEVLNRLSAYWFEQTQDIVPNHVLALPDPNVTVAKRCTPLPIEAVMRGYLSGVTGTSLWTRYEKGERDFGSFRLPDGMRKNEKLRAPAFTPSTKEKDHDRNVTPQEIVETGLMARDLLARVEDVSRRLFLRGQELARARGLILVDTKYEFGLDADGALTLIDEVHTPDSSRYWQADSYQARIARGEEPEYFDKEFLRLWFMDHCDPYHDATLPEAPADMVEELSRRYAAIFTQLTGEAVSATEENIEERIRRNFAAYLRRAS